MTNADIAVDRFEDASDRDSRILLCLQKDMRYHGGCRCLSVRAGDGDRILIILHDLTDHFCTFHHRDAHCLGCLKFRIVRVNGCRVDNQIDVICNIFGGLAIYYIDTK